MCQIQKNTWCSQDSNQRFLNQVNCTLYEYLDLKKKIYKLSSFIIIKIGRNGFFKGLYQGDSMALFHNFVVSFTKQNIDASLKNFRIKNYVDEIAQK